MEFTCHTTYDQKTLTAMARAVRKTIRAERSRIVRHYGWIVLGLLVVSLWLSWGTLWQMVLSGVVILLLLLVHWKEDAINGYFAKRKALPGTECADTTFYSDHYLVKTAAAETKWQYNKILALAETKEFLLLVMGMDHAMAMEKANLKGGSLSEFHRFLEERTGRKIQNIGG